MCIVESVTVFGLSMCGVLLNIGPNFIIEDLPSVLVLIIADHILNDSLTALF